MGAHITSAGVVDPARWERIDPEHPDCVTVKEGDTRFDLEPRGDGYGVESIQMSYSRWADLGDYIREVGAADLLFRHLHVLDGDDAKGIGPYDRTHPIDCDAVADALDVEIAAGRHEAYCDAHPSKNDPQVLCPFDADDIIRWRDFLRVCGGYMWD